MSFFSCFYSSRLWHFVQRSADPICKSRIHKPGSRRAVAVEGPTILVPCPRWVPEISKTYKKLPKIIRHLYSAKAELCDHCGLSVILSVCHSVSRVTHEPINDCIIALRLSYKNVTSFPPDSHKCISICVFLAFFEFFLYGSNRFVTLYNMEIKWE